MLAAEKIHDSLHGCFRGHLDLFNQLSPPLAEMPVKFYRHLDIFFQRSAAFPSSSNPSSFSFSGLGAP